MYVYIAGPLFSEAERWFNSQIKSALTACHIESFLPQADGILVKEKIENGHNIQSVLKEVYELDVHKLNECDLLVAVLDGAVIDEGTAFEIGYCKALKKPCIGIQTDSRRQLPQGNNPMIEGSLDFIASDQHSLVSHLKNYVANSL